MGRTRKPKAVEAWALVASEWEEYAQIAVWPTRKAVDEYLRLHKHPRVQAAKLHRITYTITPIRRSRK